MSHRRRSTRSGPSTLSAVVLVSQPVTTSTCPVSSGIMSEPMVTICTSFAIDLVLGQQRAQQDHAGRLDADLLAGEVRGRADRVLLQREERVGMLLRGHGEAADRNVLRCRQHQRRAGRHLADFVAAGGDDGDAVIVGAAGLDVEVQAFLLEISELMGTGLAQLIAAAQPAELHVERRGFRAGAIGQRNSCRPPGLHPSATASGVPGPCRSNP